MLPARDKALELLKEHVKDEYQVYHAQMVATAMEGYAEINHDDTDLWYLTGLLHDIDFHKFSNTHPAESLKWFKEWNYPEELIHAVEAHALGFNGFSTEPKSKLASCLMACDEISGIFYAYRKLNPVPYGEIKLSSIRKKVEDKNFTPKINREDIYRGCKYFGVSLDEHIGNLIKFFSKIN